ncbi:hypothetical protein D3C80_2160450 [compost metagenome]
MYVLRYGCRKLLAFGGQPMNVLIANSVQHIARRNDDVESVELFLALRRLTVVIDTATYQRFLIGR